VAVKTVLTAKDRRGGVVTGQNRRQVKTVTNNKSKTATTYICLSVIAIYPKLFPTHICILFIISDRKQRFPQTVNIAKCITDLYL